MGSAEALITAVIASLLYTAVFYSKNHATTGAEFDPAKAGVTLAVGVGVGLAATLAGNPIGPVAIETQLVAYTGVIALLESLLKAFYRGAVNDGVGAGGSP